MGCGSSMTPEGRLKKAQEDAEKSMSCEKTRGKYISDLQHSIQQNSNADPETYQAAKNALGEMRRTLVREWFQRQIPGTPTQVLQEWKVKYEEIKKSKYDQYPEEFLEEFRRAWLAKAQNYLTELYEKPSPDVFVIKDCNVIITFLQRNAQHFGPDSEVASMKEKYTQFQTSWVEESLRKQKWQELGGAIDMFMSSDMDTTMKEQAVKEVLLNGKGDPRVYSWANKLSLAEKVNLPDDIAQELKKHA